MTKRTEFLLARGNLKRQYADGRIDRETFNRRFAALMVDFAGAADAPTWDRHVEEALEVVK